MPRYLLLVSLGPVQEFIAQARRTRDLWFGSHLLSEVSRAAAREIAGRGATLIFPALDRDDPELMPCDGPMRGDAPPLSIANKIVALLDVGDVGEVAKEARRAARDRLKGLWTNVAQKHPELIEPRARETAEEQIDTLLEVFAAWAPCEDDKDYKRALAEAEEALGGRKLCHVFEPWQKQRGGILKSSLDGARESVLPWSTADRLPDNARSSGAFRRYRIGRREQLDAVGLLKRAGGEPEQFVPLPSIALAAWMELAQKERGEKLTALVRACEQRGLTRVARKMPWVQAFPFDAQIVLPERLPIYFADLGIGAGGAGKSEGDSDARRFERQHIEPLRREFSEPSPYVACLVADGDKMGEALNGLSAKGPTAHRELSLCLSTFARTARSIVETKHRGVLVYAGGDDVLAFVCLADALACARALRDTFDKAMGDAPLGPGQTRPTLSVGLGVGHVLTSLADLLELGREAEQMAKRDGRNRLAIAVEKRAGSRLAWSGSWPDDPAARLAEDAARLTSEEGRRGLPRKKIHEVERAVRAMPERPAEGAGSEAWARALEGEVSRILARSDAGSEGAKLRAPDVGLDLGGTYEERRESVRRWADRMLIADVFRSAAPRLRAKGAER
jgi:CRISPR-associated protein Cmr2